MKLRQVPHSPALSSEAYDVGGRKVSLLPGDPKEGRTLRIRVDRIAMPPDPENPPEVFRQPLGLYLSLLVGIAWDDAELALETDVPDDVLSLDDAALMSLATALYDELHSKATRRLLRPAALLEAGLLTMSSGVKSGN